MLSQSVPPKSANTLIFVVQSPYISLLVSFNGNLLAQVSPTATSGKRKTLLTLRSQHNAIYLIAIDVRLARAAGTFCCFFAKNQSTDSFCGQLGPLPALKNAISGIKKATSPRKC
ncbi:MAG: hypothetical protein ABIP46_03430 [Polaromonas sp.]